MDVPSRSEFVEKTAYAVTYAVSATVVVTVLLAVLSLLLGYGLYGVKFGQFVVGWVLFGYAVFQLRPKAAWKQDWEAEKTASERLDRAEQTETEAEASDREKAEEAARILNPFSSGGRISNREDRFGDVESESFSALVATLPPASLVPVDRDERPTEGLLIALTALCILAFSFALEFGLGV